MLAIVLDQEFFKSLFVQLDTLPGFLVDVIADYGKIAPVQLFFKNVGFRRELLSYIPLPILFSYVQPSLAGHVLWAIPEQCLAFILTS